ncbi:hypothetical protein AAF712_006003 [Marasmius tenuissimus]|uniref:Uncharacterized protein n=1 Tax=Marasmius tenuissimus TaxID=585030 RepID=A0ABR3A1U8_9AGAR
MPAVFVPDPAWEPNPVDNNLPLERAWLIGVILTGVGYGVVLTLTVMCLGPLLRSVFGRSRDTLRTVSLVYVVLLFLCATMFMAGDSTMAEYSFVDYRNIPGGPSTFQALFFSIPVSEIGNVGFVVSSWLADAVVVWRCLVVYKGCRLPFWVVCLFPCLLYANAWAFGLLWLIQISAPMGSPWTQDFNFTIPYFWSSFALNVVMTIAIVARLLTFRYRISRVLGNRHGKQYTSIASMIVESALLYTGFQLIWIVLFGLDIPQQTLFLQPLSQVQCIAPLLIVFRVTCGQAWTTTTSTQIFRTEPSGHSHELNIKKSTSTAVRTELSSFAAASQSLKYGNDSYGQTETFYTDTAK